MHIIQKYVLIYLRTYVRVHAVCKLYDILASSLR